MSKPRLSSTEATALGIEPQHRYEAMIHLIVAAQGQFVPINPDDLRGDHLARKQNSLLQAARKRNLRIVTTTRAAGVLYARLVVPNLPENPPCAQPAEPSSISPSSQ
jgi:hypothetical protein